MSIKVKTPPQTDHKAWAGAAVTVFMFLVTLWSGDPPSVESVESAKEAAIELGGSLIAGAINYLAVKYKWNYVK